MAMPDFQAYGQLIYSLRDRYSCIQRSTLVLAPIGRTLGKVEGHLAFLPDVTLDVWELIDFHLGRIRNYSYEIYRAGVKVAWYDPFEHPDDPKLASTHPHHKHVLPDIKHNRVPAPGIRFDQPNLPFLIGEIEDTLLR